VSAPGVKVISAAVGGGLRSMNGTSMATPHAAGVAALWAQSLSEDTGRFNLAALKAKVIASAVTAPLDPSAEAEDVGRGLVQAPQ
jgi:subtilisin family serine protease